MIKRLMLALVLTLATLPVLAAQADSAIAHLLQFVAMSGCAFERNGSTHTSVEASDHMRLKYKNAGSRIHTPEDFIKYAATGSSITGRPYHVTCEQQRWTSREWLLMELDRYRSSR